MKAIVYQQYGSPEVLALTEMTKPVPKDDEVLVRIDASTVTAVDSEFRAGPLVARLYTGLLRPKNPVLGTELAGQVEAVGKDVTRFAPGDRVFGASDVGFGGHAEYISLTADSALAKMPANLSVAEAAAVSNGALTALPFLRDRAGLARGQKILIVGAAGSIGTFAVQLAKHFGAEVTAVCSGPNAALCKSLGADRVIDYTRADFTTLAQRYDVVFDTVGKSSFSRCKRVLTDDGIYLTTVLRVGAMLQMLWTSMFGRKKAIFAATGLRSLEDKNADLEYLSELIAAGKLRTVIDRHYPLAAVAQAHRYVAAGHKSGNVIIDVRPAA